MGADVKGFHLAMLLKGNRALNYFALTSELPVPWRSILTTHQQLYLWPQMTVTCKLVRSLHNCLAKDLVWSVGCACNNMSALQCLSARHVLKKILQSFMHGAFYNFAWPWYRSIVNARMPSKLLYVGSIYYNRVHYIYIKSELAGVEEAFKKCFNAETTIFAKSSLTGCYAILKCISCRRKDYLTALCCARRVKKIMRRLVRILLPSRYVWSYREMICGQALERVRRFGKCCDAAQVSPFTL